MFRGWGGGAPSSLQMYCSNIQEGEGHPVETNRGGGVELKHAWQIDYSNSDQLGSLLLKHMLEFSVFYCGIVSNTDTVKAGEALLFQEQYCNTCPVLFSF